MGGNVGIGTSTPGAELNIIGALCVDDATPTCGNAARDDGTIYSVAALSATLDLAESYPTKDETLSAGEIVSLDPANPVFVRRATAVDATPLVGVVSTAPGFWLGGFNEELYADDVKLPVALSGRVPVQVIDEGGAIVVGDRIALSSVAGVGMKSSGSEEVIGIALEPMDDTSGEIEVFVNLRHHLDPTQFAIDALGNIGIGTTTPAYKLHVIGDIAATSFVNISTGALKTNINYLDEHDKENLLEKLLDIKVATYRYTTEDERNPLRLGLIAEETPSDVLSVGGKGVDIYKLATFNLASTQEIARRLASTEMRLATVEASLAGGGPALFGFGGLLDYLESLGVSLRDGAVKVKNLIVGTSEKPSGITLFNKETGEPYCIEVIGGELQHAPGECGVLLDEENQAEIENETNTPHDTFAPDLTSPTIEIIGSNPAEVERGTAYSDNGARVTDDVDQNLGYTSYLNGVKVSELQIDTTFSGTHIIEYVATDTAGNIATSTRSVIISEPSVPGEAADEIIEETPDENLIPHSNEEEAGM